MNRTLTVALIVALNLTLTLTLTLTLLTAPEAIGPSPPSTLLSFSDPPSLGESYAGGGVVRVRVRSRSGPWVRVMGEDRLNGMAWIWARVIEPLTLSSTSEPSQN